MSGMLPVTLRTPRLVLSIPTSADADAVLAHCQDAELQRYTTVPVPYTEVDARAFVEAYVPGAWAAGVEYVFGIRASDDAPLMGVVSWHRERAAIGYWLGAEHRGRGVMTASVRALLDWVFTVDDLDVLHWEAYAGNVGSAVVAQRAGFRWAGEGPCAVVGRDGEQPWGWHGQVHRDERGSVQPRTDWPVLA